MIYQNHMVIFYCYNLLATHCQNCVSVQFRFGLKYNSDLFHFRSVPYAGTPELNIKIIERLSSSCCVVSDANTRPDRYQLENSPKWDWV